MQGNNSSDYPHHGNDMIEPETLRRKLRSVKVDTSEPSDQAGKHVLHP